MPTKKHIRESLEKDVLKNPIKWIMPSFFEKEEFAKIVFNKMLEQKNHIKKFHGCETKIFNSGLTNIHFRNARTIKNKKIDIIFIGPCLKSSMEFEEAFFAGVMFGDFEGNGEVLGGFKNEGKTSFVFFLRQIDPSENHNTSEGALSILKDNEKNLENHNFSCVFNKTRCEYEFQIKLYKEKNHEKISIEYKKFNKNNDVLSQEIINDKTLCYFSMQMRLKNKCIMFTDIPETTH